MMCHDDREPCCTFPDTCSKCMPEVRELADVLDDIDKVKSDTLFFCVVTVMFYGGLTLCAFGIDGVAWYSGTALAAVVHGLLLAKREGCF